MAKKRSPRIEKLRNAILNSVPTVGVERGRLVTEAYKENEADPILIKRAKALHKILNQMTIFINEDDLLVGNQGHSLRCPPIYPENLIGWMEDEQEMDKMEARAVNPLRIPKEIRQELKDLACYWKGKTLVEKCYATFPEEVMRARKSLVFSVSLEKNAMGHCVLDYRMLLEKGYNGVKSETLARLKSLDLTNPTALKKREFLKAVVIICDAVMAFAGRYANLAKHLAEKERDKQRKKELYSISAICRKVPANPAQTFHEAVQSVWLAHVVNYIETNAYSMSFGRFDQYMYPYYEKDVQSGSLTREEAQEITNCFWCKTNEILHVDDTEMVYFHGGHPLGQHLTVGGLTREGEDTINELSYICLDAHETVELFQPDFSVRFHKNSPEEFQKRTAEVIRLGLGLPQIFNDEVIIKALVNDGLPVEDARDYTPTGCVENSTPKCWIRAPGGWLNMPKILELTLHEGKCALSGRQISMPGKQVSRIASFEEFMDLFKRHFEQIVKLHVIWSNLIDEVHAQVMPQPSVSIFIHDCIENGKDATQGGARYNFTSPLLVGIANVADSLAVIKKLVYEDREITLEELKHAMDADFVGYEFLGAKIRNVPPKYGNDIDYVDDLGREVSIMFCDEFERYQNTREGKFRPGFWSVTTNFSLGSNTAATPDGRKCGEPLSDSITPSAGMDVSGLTASLKSASKLDQRRASNGTVLNRHITPAELEGEDKLDKFLALVNGYFDLGGSNLGFNVVSSATLKKAQMNPEKYSDLMVKVAGYAALFVELGKPCQDELIGRTEHSLS
ncbi:MAG: formate C-acetyltransferase/glycerol dehydratase family glycyl radical enzyme [Deltaproteobacteria bacterium]|nr:formate C-acetyltransferase/glycerol dehydratase family glycyl radical enzyme [Deltaproteobacteria bacterium]